MTLKENNLREIEGGRIMDSQVRIEWLPQHQHHTPMLHKGTV